ncbi:hypothetical protein [Flavobacterium sp. JP2137]|uniref:hypothetical protein n=1 Tax=Flavobacterium sp. JP2137 TaxID=3414510 RepID=UPI003D2FBFB6
MKYKFTLNPFNQKDLGFKYYGIDIDSLAPDESVLVNIKWWGWTPEELQLIIDESKAVVGNQRYTYIVEGSELIIDIYIDEVLFFDAFSKQQEPELTWPFDKFIDFIAQFKAFVAENS